MKKKIKVFLVISLLVVLFGCKSKTTSTKADIVFFRNYLDQEMNDYLDMIQNKTRDFSDEFDLSFTTYKLKGINNDTFNSAVDLASKTGCRLIVLTYDYQDVLAENFNLYPNLNFLMIDANLPYESSNISSTYFDYLQVGYIAGSLATSYGLNNFTFIDRLEDSNSHELFTSFAQGVSDHVDQDKNIYYYACKNYDNDQINKIIYQQLLTTEDTVISFGEGIDIQLNKYCNNTGLRFIGIGFKELLNYYFYAILDYDNIFKTIFTEIRNNCLQSGSRSFGIAQNALNIVFNEDANRDVRDLYNLIYQDYLDGKKPQITSDAYNALKLKNIKVVLGE